MKKSVLFIKGEKINLVLLDKELHLDTIVVGANDQEVNRFTNLCTYPMGETIETDWIEKNYKNRDNVVFGIETLEGKYIGNIGLHNINLINRIATLGILIFIKEEWGNGYATEAESLMIKYAFETLGLNKIEALIFAENIASRKAAAKNHFEEEGLLKQHFYRRGKFHDIVQIGLLRSNWEEHKK